jgi:peroxiredoxin
VTTQLLLGTIVALLALILASLWIVLYQLVRQQGRLLLRIDRAEHHVAFNAFPPGLAAPQVAGPRSLPPGDAAPAFELPDIAGRTVALRDFLGKRVLAIHWSTQCGYCIQIAPDLARVQGDLETHGVQVLLVSYGDAGLNRNVAEEHGLKCPALLQKVGDPGVPLFAHFGTPAAYLIDETGKIAEPVAVGAEQVPALILRLVEKRPPAPGCRPLSESRIERKGLKAGTVAPSFTLPSVSGSTISLETSADSAYFSSSAIRIAALARKWPPNWPHSPDATALFPRS